jgi:4-oxalocrotonate tautomerase
MNLILFGNNLRGKMPVITMEVGKLSNEQKNDLIKGFTEVASEITGIDKKFIINYS